VAPSLGTITDGNGEDVCALCRGGADATECRARSASFVLPAEIAELVRGGMELGDADDAVRVTSRLCMTRAPSLGSALGSAGSYKHPAKVPGTAWHFTSWGTSTYFTPPRARFLSSESGVCRAQVFKRFASGQGDGTVGRLTNGLISRTDYYAHTVALALVPLMSPALYPAHNTGVALFAPQP
jgi:hypothetical protein